MRKALLLLTSTLILFSTANAVPTEAASSTSTQSKRQTIKSQQFDLAKQAVFRISPISPKGDRTGSGTAFLVRSQKSGATFVVTNYHICANYQKLQLQQGEELYTVSVLKFSSTHDLCITTAPEVLKNTATPLQMAKRDAKPGDLLSVYGHPQGLPFAAFLGHLVQTRQEITLSPLGLPTPINISEIDIPVFPGNSGSPVLNERHEVVGVIFALIIGPQMGLYIPTSDLRRLINEIESES